MGKQAECERRGVRVRIMGQRRGEHRGDERGEEVGREERHKPSS